MTPISSQNKPNQPTSLFHYHTSSHSSRPSPRCRSLLLLADPHPDLGVSVNFCIRIHRNLQSRILPTASPPSSPHTSVHLHCSGIPPLHGAAHLGILRRRVKEVAAGTCSAHRCKLQELRTLLAGSWPESSRPSCWGGKLLLMVTNLINWVMCYDCAVAYMMLISAEK